jgi:hypothetical protein
MGLDTRFWGPSAWQLFHLIAFTSDHPDDVLNAMKDILPCRFCRESTTQFVKDHPLRGDPGKWLYDLHNRVNGKLRSQCKTDPAVVDPGPDPSFADVKAMYLALKPAAVPGRDFLFSIATNYPDDPEPEQMATQRHFLHALVKVYPFPALRAVATRYLQAHEPRLERRKDYQRWMYGLLKALSREIKVPIPSFKGYAQHVAYYKSGCAKTTYHGKTCRKLAGGGRTKDRDRRTTYRVSHRRLL